MAVERKETQRWSIEVTAMRTRNPNLFAECVTFRTALSLSEYTPTDAHTAAASIESHCVKSHQLIPVVHDINF